MGCTAKSKPQSIGSSQLQVDQSIPKNQLANRFVKFISTLFLGQALYTVRTYPKINIIQVFQKQQMKKQTKTNEKVSNKIIYNLLILLEDKSKARIREIRQHKIYAVEDEQFYERIEKKQKDLTQEETKFLMNSMKQNLLFKYLEDLEMFLQFKRLTFCSAVIIKELFYCEVPDFHTIFEQGDKASGYFIIESGQIEIIIDGQSKKLLQSGEGFGEMALIQNCERFLYQIIQTNKKDRRLQKVAGTANFGEQVEHHLEELFKKFL